MERPLPTEVDAHVPADPEPEAEAPQDDGDFVQLDDHDDVPDEIRDGVDALLGAHPEANGGTRIAWQGTHGVMVVRIVGRHDDLTAQLRAVAGDRLVLERGTRTEASLRALQERLHDETDELEALGIGLSMYGVSVEREAVVATIVATAADDARRTLRERYGPALEVEAVLPGWVATEPRAFGSWSAEGRALAVFYAIDHNGERPHGCRADERDDAVVVTVEIEQPTGAKTAIGGWRLLTAELDLDRPLGDRRVIDAATGEARPSLRTLRGG